MAKIGEATFDDILVDELMIATYDFNSKTPRFFSKYFEKDDPGRYRVPLRIAVGGSSSAPTYFDPEPYTDHFNITSQFVDGGIICNNPALYSYILAKEMHQKKNIRVVSLGTGVTAESEKTV